MCYLDKIKKFVYDELNSDCSGHDYYHAIRVFNNAKQILSKMDNEFINDKIIYVSTLIHDCVDHKLFNDIEVQIEKIKKLLKDDFTNEEISQILEIIQTISFSKGNTLTNINAQIVCDADRLDAIGAIGIIRTIEYGTIHNRKFNDGTNNSTINHFYDKLLKLKDLMYTNVGKEMAINRHQFLEQFLKQYYKELGEEKCLL